MSLPSTARAQLLTAAAQGITAAVDRSRALRSSAPGSGRPWSLSDALRDSRPIRDASGQPLVHDGPLLETVSGAGAVTSSALGDALPAGGAILGPVVARVAGIRRR